MTFDLSKCLVNFNSGSLAADLVSDMRFEVIGTHQLDGIWYFLFFNIYLPSFPAMQPVIVICLPMASDFFMENRRS